MKLSILLHTAFIITAAVACLTTTGCRSNKDKFGSADVGFDRGQFVDGENFMGGARFDDGSLPRVTGVEFSPVYFAYDNYAIPPSEYGKIESVVSFMRSNPNVVAVTEGHCDERGTTEYNMSLGEYRAQSVREYMIRSGISGDRLQTVSFGKEQPAVQGHNEAAWARNRRGEFALYRRR